MELMTALEVADFLSVARTTIYKLVDRYEFPKAIEIGGSRRWRRDEVVAWMQARDESR